MSSEDEDMEYRPDAVEVFSGLPIASKDKYDKVYDVFQKWNKINGASPVTEDILMKYFSELAENRAPSSLWVHFSMLKATLRSNDIIDISSYSTLLDFLKRKNAGYKPVKSIIFTEEEIEKFVNEAPDEYWLDVKVVCIFGVNGVRSSNKLVDVRIENIKQYDDLILVTIPRTKTFAKRSFTLTGTFFDVVKKYIALRPENTIENRLFVQYREGKCRTQPIGRNKFLEVPRRIAKYLKLPHLERYSANSFRINSDNLSASTNVWNPPNVAEEPVQYSLDYETGLLKMPHTKVSYPSPTVSTARPLRTTMPTNKTIDDTNRNTNSHTNGNKNEHVCTISCAQVQCAKEENEASAFHAFNILKPSGFVIAEITPTLFPSGPMCRWIVAYRHLIEPISSFNADETFDEITRSTPLNVKIVQKYIRWNSSQLFAAYVVVYGVNCRCQKPTNDPLSCPLTTDSSDVFSVNELKCEF